MKKIIFTLVLVIAVVGAFAQENSASSKNNPATIYVQAENHQLRAGTCEFLIFMDNLPWGSSAIQTILTNNGESWVLKGSADMATEDFSLYDVIIIASDQVPGFYVNFEASFTKFVNFVTAGGRLEVHAATCGWNSPCGYSVDLPGGVYTVEDYENYNEIVTPLHPIVAGVSDPFSGTYASHGNFFDLVPGTTIITVDQTHGLPTTIQYNYGTGTVTATCCTYEYGWNNGQEAGEMLVNNLNYSCEFVPTPTTPVAPWALGIGIFLIVAITIFRVWKHS
jgi:hypothetical protein